MVARRRSGANGDLPQHKVRAMDDHTPSLRAWSDILARYREPNSARSILEIVMTVPPLVLLWLLMWASLDIGYWLCLLLSVPAAGFLVRLFMIQHDCGHGAFFRQRVVNDWVGRVIGVVTLTPYDFWRRSHAIHHAGSGNLDRRGIGDIDMLTVREYLALPEWRRLLYRLYRHPLVMFGIGPIYAFVLRQRLPFGLIRSGWQPWASTMATNAAIAIVAVLLMWLVGVGPFLLVHLPITFFGAAIGVWLFYVQHQFEHTSGNAMRVGVFTRRPCMAARIIFASGAALVHRQYRRASRPSSVQPNSVLPAAARVTRSPATCRRRPSHVAGKPEMSAHGPVERRAAARHLISRAAHHGPGGKRVASTGMSVFTCVGSKAGCRSL